MRLLGSALCLMLGVGAAQAAPEDHTYALILTNNASLSLERPNLSYADDDGAQYAELFEAITGATHRVTLLTRFDAGSQKLFPAWAERALPPTRDALAATVAVLGERLLKDRDEGHASTVYLIFAGHGDIESGSGFIELEDQRLTARELDEEVISKLPANRIHLILDSCNSYFMLNPRKPGGKRWEVKASDRTEGLLERHPNVGAIVSTSSEGVTYEWSELQSGIFSYELRSGLRGAADVDGDAAVSYDELAAFVRTANASVVNEAYRPRVFARGPGAEGGEVFARAPRTARRLVLPAEAQKRLTLRGREGIRVLDVHKEAGTAMTLWLGESHPSVRVDERWRGEDARVRTLTRVWDQAGSVGLEALERSGERRSGRGEHQVFRRLFDEPFGSVAFEAAMSSPPDDDAASFGITRRELQRVEAHLVWMSESDEAERIGDGLLNTTLGTLTLAGGITGLVTADDDYGLAAGGVVTAIGAVQLGFAISDFTVSADTERELERLRASPPADEAERARAVRRIEAAMADSAEAERSGRRVSAVLSFIAGGLAATAAVGSGVAAITGGEEEINEGPGGTTDSRVQGAGWAVGPTVVFSILAAVGIGHGVYLLGTDGPRERAWHLYQRTGQPGGELAFGEVRPTLKLDVSPAGLALSGSF